MDRRTHKLLTQMLQQMEQRGAPAAMVQAQPARVAVLERHLDLWDRLNAIRRLDPARGDITAGRARMLAALSAAPAGGRGIFSRLLLTPILRSAALVLGLLALTGAAAGASAALGGPHIWRSVGVNRNSERAIERSESSGQGLNPTDDRGGSESGGTDGSGGNGASSGEGLSSAGSDTGGGESLHDDGSSDYNDGITSGAVPSGGPEGTGAASSTPDDELGEEDDEEDEKKSATPKLDLTPTPDLQGRSNMTYYVEEADDAGDADDGDDAGKDAVDHEDEDSTVVAGGDGNPGPSAAVEPHRGPSDTRKDQERQKGQGQTSQQPSRR